MAKKKAPTKKPKAQKGNGHAPKTTAKADVKIEHFTQQMRCELSEADILERSRRQSRLLSEKALKQEEIKGMTAHLKASVKQIDAEISKTTAEINDGACYRDVQCERRFIYRTGKVVEIRNDTGAVTFERAMSGPERQMDLPKPKSKAKAPSQEGTTKAPAEVLQEHLEKADAELAGDVPDSETPTNPPPSDDEPSVGDEPDEEQTGSVPAE